MDIPDSPMDFGATSIIVSGLLRIQKADVDLLGLHTKKIFDFWWSGILLPPCFVDQKVGQNPENNEKGESALFIVSFCLEHSMTY